MRRALTFGPGSYFLVSYMPLAIMRLFLVAGCVEKHKRRVKTGRVLVRVASGARAAKKVWCQISHKAHRAHVRASDH